MSSTNPPSSSQAAKFENKNKRGMILSDSVKEDGGVLKKPKLHPIEQQREDVSSTHVIRPKKAQTSSVMEDDDDRKDLSPIGEYSVAAILTNSSETHNEPSIEQGMMDVSDQSLTITQEMQLNSAGHVNSPMVVSDESISDEQSANESQSHCEPNIRTGMRAGQSGRAFDSHNRSILESQLGGGSNVQAGDDGSQIDKKCTNESTIARFDWKASFVQADSGPQQQQDKEIDFRLVQMCASSWSLEQQLHRLVLDFNATGREQLLIEFTQRRNDFLRHCLLYLNTFWSVITGMTKTLLVERVQQACSGESKVSVEFMLRSKANFRDVHENKFITIWTFNEQRSSIVLSSLSIMEFWLKSANRRTCAAVVFDPRPLNQANSSESAVVNLKSNFNLWRGYNITREATLSSRTDLNNTESLKLEIKPFLDHIRNIWCKGDEDAYQYCVNWMASLTQRPWRKLGVAIVLQGDPGSGKGTFS
jgi:ubiquitin